MVEGGQIVYKSEQWFVWDSQTERDIHLLDRSHLLTICREEMIQVFRSMDSLGIHCGDLQKELQLGSDNFQKIEHMCIAGSDTKRRGGTHFPHSLIPSRCDLCTKCLFQHEFKLACYRAPCPLLFQHTMREQV
jgi:hypothetical protein